MTKKTYLMLFIAFMILLSSLNCLADKTYYGFRFGSPLLMSTLESFDKDIFKIEDETGLMFGIIPEFEYFNYPVIKTLSFSFSAFLDYPILSFISYMPEIIVNRRLIRILFRDMDPEDIYEFQNVWCIVAAGYIKVSPRNWFIRPGLYFGPYIAAKLTSRYSIVETCEDCDKGYTITTKEKHLSNISFLNAGATLGIELAIWKLLFDFEFFLDFTPFYKSKYKLNYGGFNFQTGFRL